MPRISNEQLTAERKELAAALTLEPGETLVQALARRDKEMTARVTRLETLVATQGEALLAAEEVRDAAAVQSVVESREAEPGLKPSASAPGDFARYPKPGEYIPPAVQIPEEGGPPQSPVQGDMTPGYAEWVLDTHGPDEVKKRWAGRIHLLSERIRRALA